MSKLPSARRDSIPILYTRGTYYEVGFDVGATFRGVIEDFLGSYSALHKVLLPAYETDSGKVAYQETLEAVNANYPHYVRELQGVADGAKVSFLQLMLLHMDLIVPKNAGKTETSSTYGCSTVCCTNESQVLLGHTEDAVEEILNRLYIVSAHITEEKPQGRWGTKEERFTALCYAGQLPGFCMGYNQHGLVYSINLTCVELLPSAKTPRTFLSRALLAAETMKEAQLILSDQGVGSADGFSVNMCFAKSEGDYLFHNIEVGPSENKKESQLSVLTISSGEYFFHANKFIRLKIKEDDEELRSSQQRHARATQCHPIDSWEKMLAFLSDTSIQDFPVFREGEIDAIYTTLIGIFDLLEKSWTIWMKNPQMCKPLLSLPLNFK